MQLVICPSLEKCLSRSFKHAFNLVSCFLLLSYSLHNLDTAFFRFMLCKYFLSLYWFYFHVCFFKTSFHCIALVSTELVYIDEAGLGLNRDPPASASWVLQLLVCATIPGITCLLNSKSFKFWWSPIVLEFFVWKFPPNLSFWSFYLYIFF